MANIKDYVYNLEQEIAETIGFTVPKNNIPSQPIKPMEQADAVLEGDTQQPQEEKENQTILEQPNMDERF